MGLISLVTKIFFYCWVFLLPLQTRFFWEGAIPGNEFSRYSLFLTDVLFLVWAGITVLSASAPKPVAAKQVAKKTDRFLLIGSFFLFLAIGLSFMASSYKWHTLYFTGRLVLAASLVWLLPRLKPSIWKTIALLVFSACLQAALGLAQFLLQQSWSSKWFGLALHDPAVPGTSVVEFGLERWLRAYGGLPHPNVLGGLLAVTLIILFFWCWDAYARIWYNENPRANIVKAFRLEIVTIFGSFALVLAGLISTFSRSAWLATLVGLVIFKIMIFKTKDSVVRSAGWQALLKMSIYGALVVGMFLIIWWPLFAGRALVNGRLEEKSITERQYYQNQAVYLLKSNWLTGVGLGNFTQAVRDKINPLMPAYFYQPAHNVYLLTLVEVGAAVIIFWVCLLFWLGRRIKQEVVAHRKPYQLILMSAFPVAAAVLLISSFFDHYLWSLPFGLSLMGLVLALSVAEPESKA